MGKTRTSLITNISNNNKTEHNIPWAIQIYFIQQQKQSRALKSCSAFL